MERTKHNKRDSGDEDNGSFLMVNKSLLKRFGPDRAVLLSNLIDKYKMFKAKNMLTDGEWFFQTNQQLMVATGMGLYKLRNCKNSLILEGAIETRMRYFPTKEFYRICPGIPMESPSVGFPHGHSSGFPTDDRLVSPRSIKETIDKENKEKDTTTGVVDNLENSSIGKITPKMFDQFWKIYPIHINESKAKREWNKLCHGDSPPTWRTIKSAIRSQIKSERWKKEEGQYIPQPTNWIKDERWKDDVSQMISYDKKDGKPKEISAFGQTYTLYPNGDYYHDDEKLYDPEDYYKFK